MYSFHWVTTSARALLTPHKTQAATIALVIRLLIGFIEVTFLLTEVSHERTGAAPERLDQFAFRGNWIWRTLPAGR
jgi:hypothetical protein